MYLFRQPHPQLSAWHGLSEAPQTAKQIYAGQSQVRELTDRGFQNIFLDRGKLIVVAFWADSCRPCDAVASTVVSVAQKIAQGPHARLVKFYHAQWDPAVNPRLHMRYGFKNVPVVFFYYMCSGTQPTRETPLLEASTRGDRFDTDAATYLRNIETILHRHGHLASRRTIAESKGWGHSHHPIHGDDFKHVDGMLVAPSPVQKYFLDFYRDHPQTRIARVAKVVDRSQFDVIYQRMNRTPPGAEVMGTVDRTKGIVYLVSFGNQQVFLNSAVHEAVHLFACTTPQRVSHFYLDVGSAVTEGFTQYVTERILEHQNVKMSERPYAPEREIADKLVEWLGLPAVADDYFSCTNNVRDALARASAFNRFVTLRMEAENATSEALRKQKYKEIIQLINRARNARRLP